MLEGRVDSTSILVVSLARPGSSIKEEVDNGINPGGFHSAVLDGSVDQILEVKAQLVCSRQQLTI